MRASQLDQAAFDDLAARDGQNLISVFIPTHRKGREIAQDQIRFKNELSDLDDRLEQLGWKPRQRSERLAKATVLLEDGEFWEHQDAGLAVFIDDEGQVESVSTTRTVPAFSTVMPVFMLRPLVADIHALSVPVLALTRDEVGLFVATRYSVEALSDELPSYDDVNWFVDREVQRQQHPDRSGTTRSRHGHEDATRDDEDLTRFLREVDTALEGFDPTTPLIVLGDDGLVARFANVSGRETTSPPNSGITAPFSAQEVSELVTDVIAEMEQARLETLLDTARDRLGVGMGTFNLEEALPSAMSGRVGQVIADVTAAPVWGRFDQTAFDTDIHDTPMPGDVDLLDRLVVWGRQNGAEVVATDVPVDGRSFVVVYRY
jgi:hypothetical protein